MKKNIVQQSIFIKLFTVFFSVILILFAIAYSIYNWGIDIIRKEIISEACIQNKNISDDLNREFKRIIMLQYDLVDNWDLMRVSTPLARYYNDYEQSLMRLRIKDKIIAIKTSSRIIEDIQVIIPLANKSIETVSEKDIDKESLELIQSYKDMNNKQILYYNDNLMLVSEYPQLYYKRDRAPDYLIHTTISKQNLIMFLNDMSIYKESKSFIFSESRNMLISNDDEEMSQKIRMEVLKGKGQKIVTNKVAIENTHVLSKVIDGMKYIVVYTDTGIQDIKLVRYISEEVAFAGLGKYRTIMWVFALSAIIIIVFFSKSLYQTIHTPLKKLVNAFKRVQKADFTVAINHKSKDEFRYIYEGFNEMVYKLDDLIEQVYKQKILAEKAKLKQLQAQINPHFLYNSFLILSNRIQIGDNDFAAEFCKNLGSYFMFVTRNKTDIVSLKYEIEHASTYAKIQEARFRNRLNMEIDALPEEYENISVPRLILQPILENAFEHTLENMDTGGYLHMGYRAHEQYLDIIVEDNGEELEDDKLDELRSMLDKNDIEITGMINIHQRLKLVYSEECGIILDRSELGGLSVTVRILLENITSQTNCTPLL